MQLSIWNVSDSKKKARGKIIIKIKVQNNVTFTSNVFFIKISTIAGIVILKFLSS